MSGRILPCRAPLRLEKWKLLEQQVFGPEVSAAPVLCRWKDLFDWRPRTSRLLVAQLCRYWRNAR
jgi:hypothetical protein